MIKVAAVVTDLDNTLYDWISYFAEALFAMSDVAAHELKIESGTVLSELKAVHQKYGDSEYPFALLETRSAMARWGDDRAAAKAGLQAAFNAFNEVRDHNLHLYPGTLAAIMRIRALGCPVIAHTEASIVNASFRLRKLGLTPHVSRLYALEHVGLGHPVPERRESASIDASTFRIVPRSQRKPNPHVLQRICSQEHLDPSEVVYVGDSITRDIGMAKAAGCWAAWAKYGTIFAPDAWKRLVVVSHWSQADVSRAEPSQAVAEKAEPDAVLMSGFKDIFNYFKFTPKTSD